ncbi:MAG: phosphotransferase [Actinocatenispora sp.]
MRDAALGHRGRRTRMARAALWLHDDLHPTNILVDHGQLSAVIDFGDITLRRPSHRPARNGDALSAQLWSRIVASAGNAAARMVASSSNRHLHHPFRH